MKSIKILSTVTILTLGLMCALPLMSRADEMQNGGAMMQDQGMMKDSMKVQTAIDGYCPVCVIHGMMNKGTEDYVTVYNGKKYLFAGMEQQKAFLENPEEYTKDLEMKYKDIMMKK